MGKKKFRPVPKEMLGDSHQIAVLTKLNEEYSSQYNRNSRERSYNNDSNSRWRNQGQRDGSKPGEESSSASTGPWRSSNDRPQSERYQSSTSRNNWSGPRESSNNDSSSTWRSEEGSTGTSRQFRNNWASRDRSSNESSSQWRSNSSRSENQVPSTEGSTAWRSSRQRALAASSGQTARSDNYEKEESDLSQSASSEDKGQEVQTQDEISEGYEADESVNISVVEDIQPTATFSSNLCDDLVVSELEDSAIYKSDFDNLKIRHPSYNKMFDRSSENFYYPIQNQCNPQSHSQIQGVHRDVQDLDAMSRPKPRLENVKLDGNKDYDNKRLKIKQHRDGDSERSGHKNSARNYSRQNHATSISDRGYSDTSEESSNYKGQNYNRSRGNGRFQQSNDDSVNYEYSQQGRQSGSFSSSRSGRNSMETGNRNSSSRTSLNKSIFLGSPTKEKENFLSYFNSKEVTDFIKIKEEDQDLFEVGDDYSLAHCVAADLNMGSGIAVEFRQRFKKVGELMDQRAAPGGMAILELKGRYIYYLVTKRKSQEKPTYDSLWSSLLQLRDHMQAKKIKKLAIPRIGCGLDRLNWDVVKPMLEFLFKNDDVEILVCNHQPDAPNMKTPKKCRVVNETKPITEIDAETIIIYFGSQDGKPTKEMKILDEKYKFLSHFDKAPRVMGDNVRWTPIFPKNYVLYGCIVKQKVDDEFGFVNFVNCLQKIKKNSKTDNFFYIAFQSLEDDLLNAKILNLMRYTLKDCDIYICGCTEPPAEG